MKEASGRFFEKKLRKKLLQMLHGLLKRPPGAKKSWGARGPMTERSEV
jgi:hypothetical protein